MSVLYTQLGAMDEFQKLDVQERRWKEQSGAIAEKETSNFQAGSQWTIFRSCWASCDVQLMMTQQSTLSANEDADRSISTFYVYQPSTGGAMQEKIGNY